MIFHPFPTLTTARLQLRQLDEKDAPAIFFLRSDNGVNRYIKRSRPKNLTDALAFIRKTNRQISAATIIYWGIQLRENPSMIGSICLWNFSADLKKAEVGYDLHPKLHNKGLMSEALTSILHFGFEELKLSEIEAYTHSQNEESKRLLIKHDFILLPDRVDVDNADNLIFSKKIDVN